MIKISIYLLVFLLPLFWLPFSFEVFEFNKQYLLFFLVSMAFFAWLAKIVICDKEIRFRRTLLDIPVLIFLGVAILSTIFSVDRTSSLFGFYGRFSNGLIGLLSLGVLYFLITNNVSINSEQRTTNKITIHSLLKVFIWSVFFVILISYFSIFGVWAKLNSLISLPWVMLSRTFNPVSGSLEGLAIFLAVVVILLVGLLLHPQIHPEKPRAKFKDFLYWILLLSSLFLLIIIDFTTAWIVLLVTLLLFLGFTLGRRIFKENVNKLLLPIFLIIITVLFITSSPLKNTEIGPLQFTLPQEQVLNQGDSWKVSFRAATENVKSGFLGSGIGTYFYDFSKFKSPEFNQSRLWQIRFDRAGNYIAEIAGTMGILGILSYLILIGFSLIIWWLFLQKRPFLSNFPLWMVFFSLLVCQFVYYQNTTLGFLFWLVLGLSVVSWQKPIKDYNPPTTSSQASAWAPKTYSFKDFPELSLVFTSLLILVGLAILATYFFMGKFYAADINYAEAQKMALGPARTNQIEKAVGLNPHSAQYQIILARTYLAEALEEIAKPVAEQNSILIQNKVAKAIEQGKKATEISPNRVVAWETLGMIYRDIRLVATGATEWGIKSFEKAITLEPTNPVLYTELGKLLILESPEKAKEKFTKALELKPDYIGALIQEVLILEREGNLELAIEKMESLSQAYPFNTEILFQLGRLYFNNNQLDQAIAQFKGVVNLIPNHSNALYSLGVAYTQKGEKKLAIEALEKVLELNPGNQDIIQKLEELRK